MSEPTNQTPQPDTGAGAATTPTTVDVQQPDGGAAAQPGQPFAVFPTASAFNERLQRETRKELDQRAKAMGYDTWQAFEASTQPATPPATTADSGQPTAAESAPPTPPTPGPDEAARLRMALKVASDKGLPTALVSRLQGNTAEEMAADADQLLGLVQAPRGPGIPGVPRNNQTTTFTRAQLRDPAFVRANAAAIQAAAREGRIVDA